MNRPFDDQTQDRIRLEAEAVLLILQHVEDGEWLWVRSEVTTYEIAQTPEKERRRRVELLAQWGSDIVSLGEKETSRSQDLERFGFKAFDALHLACAESATVDVFLTTDDSLLRLASRKSEQLKVQVANPLTWLSEVQK